MRFSVSLAALAATVIAATPAIAAQATATAEARGIVLQSLTLTKVDDLDFGTVAADALFPGTVSVNATTNARSKTGAVVLMPGAFTRARFDGLGEVNQAVQLTLSQPAGGVLLSGANSITALLALDSNGTSRVTDSTGKFTAYVGGDFGIAANQANGLYTATFDLTADYQ